MHNDNIVVDYKLVSDVILALNLDIPILQILDKFTTIHVHGEVIWYTQIYKLHDLYIDIKWLTQ